MTSGGSCTTCCILPPVSQYVCLPHLCLKRSVGMLIRRTFIPMICCLHISHFSFGMSWSWSRKFEVAWAILPNVVIAKRRDPESRVTLSAPRPCVDIQALFSGRKREPWEALWGPKKDLR
ncbi:uncharacterized protein PV07_08565 [Cladophialophora immunda]|uniref:Uncharacterized protein n=1 Tax=Cladophialophora immunda TaxID=569365 RepID=A0A0D2AKA2_9EURO|nr:uncharacterized protein PV07_08565 [Cladophialophora immunda]KIW25382.1 hypothetical protein PV07_08565 [Cladophialophora immunda]